MTFPSHRGLFVIGVARSGTTVLQNALNHSGEIYLLGEPDLHVDDGLPGFAGRFNAMHRGWRNQENKSSWLPPLLAEDEDWRAYLDKLALHHRWVGSKIVVNPDHAPDWMERLEHFQAAQFYDAHFLFVFRDPLAVARSYRGVEDFAGQPPHSPAFTFANYAATVALFTRMVRTFPHVRALIHEDAHETAFADIGAWLGIDLGESASYYDGTRIRSYDETVDAVADDQAAVQMSLLYDDLRMLAGNPISRPQLEQNDGHLDPAHFTLIGAIDRRARFLRDFLDGGRS